ncbi:hypothetical protein GCM10022206_62060 [Streptomyces chiangmaiensis]
MKVPVRIRWATAKPRSLQRVQTPPPSLGEAPSRTAGHAHERVHVPSGLHPAPPHGAVAKTRVHRLAHALTSWLYPLLHRVAPGHATTTDHLGRAMLAVTRPGVIDSRILYSRDINRPGA